MCNLCGNLNHEPAWSRRNFLKIAGGLAAGLALPGRELLAAPSVPKPQNVLTPDEAFERLKQGNHRYVTGVMRRNDFIAEREALAGGQNPFAGVLSCADSRVAPEYAFDAGRGDLFVVRIAGNFTDNNTVASLEYAVQFLNTPLLVVLGHDKCGAVDAAIKAVRDGVVLPGHLPHLVEHIGPAVKIALPEPGIVLDNAIRENVLYNANNLKTTSPIITDAIAQGKVRVVGGIYKLTSGHIDWIT